MEANHTEQADAIREALEMDHSLGHGITATDWDEIAAALSSLVAALAAAEQRAKDAEAQVVSMTQSVQVIQTERGKADRRIETLEKALRVIEEPMHFDTVELLADDRHRMQEVARAALAGEEGGEANQ